MHRRKMYNQEKTLDLEIQILESVIAVIDLH